MEVEINIWSLLRFGKISGLRCNYKVMSNIKLRNEQNLFFIGGRSPFPHS